MICRAGAKVSMELTTPTDPGVDMFAAGLLKFGWLKTFCMAASKVNLNRSVMGNRLAIVRLCSCRPGACRIFTPLLPKRPAGGRTKAVASNHRVSFRSERSRLPLAMRSGRPPDVLVFDGSAPEKLGLKYW